MKNLFKFGFLAIAISLSVAACNTDRTDDTSSDSTILSDTTTLDTTMQDTMMTDTSTL